MWLDVAFTPAEVPLALADLPGALCGVIDVVRATTTLTVLGERGCRSVLIAPSVEAARHLAAQQPAMVLIGEVGGLAPAGFDFGNSPAELAHADLRQRDVVFATTNGTKAILACHSAGAGMICTAALRNARAAVAYAWQQAAGSAYILVCAGRAGRVALDDAYAAGMIVAIAEQMAPSGNQLHLTERARLAAHIARTSGDPLDVLRRSDAGKIGVEADLPWCAEVSTSAIVPCIRPLVEGVDIIADFKRIVS